MKLKKPGKIALRAKYIYGHRYRYQEKDEATLAYEYISEQINREDCLVNFRLTWTLTLNGFIFAAWGYLTKGQDGMSFLQFLFPLLGILISASGYIGVFAAREQLIYLIDEYDKWKKVNQKLEKRHWPRPFGNESDNNQGSNKGKNRFWLHRVLSSFGAHNLGVFSSLFLPGMLVVVWIIFLFYNIYFKINPVSPTCVTPL